MTAFEKIRLFITEHFNEGDLFVCLYGGSEGVYHKHKLQIDEDGDVSIETIHGDTRYIYVKGELAEKHKITKVCDKIHISNWDKNRKRSKTIKKLLDER